jgi:hypothetical protein
MFKSFIFLHRCYCSWKPAILEIVLNFNIARIQGNSLRGALVPKRFFPIEEDLEFMFFLLRRVYSNVLDFSIFEVQFYAKILPMFSQVISNEMNTTRHFLIPWTGGVFAPLGPFLCPTTEEKKGSVAPEPGS